MRTVTWLAVALVGALAVPIAAWGQDLADAATWNVESGDWDNDDNWVDQNGEIIGTPTAQADLWALVGGGIATVDGGHEVGGLTIQSTGGVELQAGSSLEVSTDPGAFSVGQTQVDRRGTLRLMGDASFQGLSANIDGDLILDRQSNFQLSEGLTFTGTLEFPVNEGGNPSIEVGGQATLGGTIIPTFDGIDLTFGNSIRFVEADSIAFQDPVLQLPEGTSFPRGLFAEIAAVDGGAGIVVGNRPILQVDRGTSEGKIVNANGGPVAITGYAVESELGLLNAAGFSGFGGTAWDRPSPLSTVLSEFNLTAVRTLDVGDSLDIGNVYDVGATHPSDEDVKFMYFTPEGQIMEGLVEYTGPANDLVLNVNPETGEATIQNLSSEIEPVEVTGYRIVSRSNSLQGDAWTSLAAEGESGWLEQEPTSEFISEINPTDSIVFSNGTVFSAG